MAIVGQAHECSNLPPIERAGFRCPRVQHACIHPYCVVSIRILQSLHLQKLPAQHADSRSIACNTHCYCTLEHRLVLGQQHHRASSTRHVDIP